MDTGNIMENQLQQRIDGYENEEKVKFIKTDLRKEFQEQEGIPHHEVFVSYSAWLEDQIVQLKL